MTPVVSRRSARTKPTSVKKVKKVEKSEKDTWVVNLYGTWERRSTNRDVLKRWADKLRQPYPYSEPSALPGLKLKVTGNFVKRYSWESGLYADSGTFEIAGLEVEASTEAEAFRKAKQLVQRRLKAQICTLPRLTYT